jgi:hypothetical protein
MRRKRNMLVFMAMAGGVLFASSAWAQQSSVILSGPTAFDNLSATLGQPPGGMVSRGVGRALGAADVMFGRTLAPNITETEPRRSVGDQFLVDSIPTVADEITRIIFVLINQWFARAGLGELVPDISLIGSSLDEPPDDPATPDTTVRPTRPGRKTRQ